MPLERSLLAGGAGLALLLVAGWFFPAPACPAVFSSAALGSALSTLDDSRAKRVLELGLQHDSANPIIHLALARLAMRDERYSEADAHLKRAEAGLAVELEVRLTRAEWWVATGRGRLALARLEEMAAAHPHDPRVPLARAEALRRMMRFKASLPFYQQYLAMPDPDTHRRDVYKLRYVRLSNALHDFEAKSGKEGRR